MVQSLVSYIKKYQVKAPNLLVIDEVHHARASTYEKLINLFKSTNPNMMLFGVTATPARGDGLGMDKFFSNIANSIKLPELIEAGALVKPIVKVIDNDTITQALLSSNPSIDEVIMPANRSIVKHWISENKDNPRKTIGFTSTIEHTNQIADMFNAEGIITDVVTGKHSKKERERILHEYTYGDTQILLNANVLTEGFDHPETSCVMLLRNRSQKSAMIQMIGRGLRIAPNKEDCLIIDFGESVKTHKDLFPASGMKDKEKLSRADATEGEGEKEKSQLIDFDLKIFEVMPVTNPEFKGNWMALDRDGRCFVTGCLHYHVVATQLGGGKFLIMNINTSENTKSAEVIENTNLDDISNQLIQKIQDVGLLNEYNSSIKSMKSKSLSDSQKKYIPDELHDKLNRYEGSLFLTVTFNKKFLDSNNELVSSDINKVLH
jgi:superfamily II DNA or RNA helicase